jgi:hypothetical protein
MRLEANKCGDVKVLDRLSGRSWHIMVRSISKVASHNLLSDLLVSFLLLLFPFMSLPL